MLPRVIISIVLFGVIVALGVVQAGSTALYRGHTAFGERVYRAIDRVAPASFVNDMLAWSAMQRGDAAAAQRYALQMPAGPRRDDWLARAARARGDRVLAREYFFAAADIDALQREIADLARTDIFGALSLEARFRDRLIALGTHPDAVAASYAKSGEYEMWLRRYRTAADDTERAVALAPRNKTYLLAAGYDEYFAGDRARAAQFFSRGLAIDPACSECAAGLRRARNARP